MSTGNMLRGNINILFSWHESVHGGIHILNFLFHEKNYFVFYNFTFHVYLLY